MKKIVWPLVMSMVVLVLSGCGGQPSKTGMGEAMPEYEDALDVLNSITGVYKEDELFSLYGGDQENAVMDMWHMLWMPLVNLISQNQKSWI